MLLQRLQPSLTLFILNNSYSTEIWKLFEAKPFIFSIIFQDHIGLKLNLELFCFCRSTHSRSYMIETAFVHSFDVFELSYTYLHFIFYDIYIYTTLNAQFAEFHLCTPVVLNKVMEKTIKKLGYFLWIYSKFVGQFCSTMQWSLAQL